MVNRLKVQDFRPCSTACNSERNDCLYFQIANPPKANKVYSTQVADSLASLRRLNRELEEKNKDLRERFNSMTWNSLHRAPQAEKKLFKVNIDESEPDPKQRSSKGTRLANQIKQIGSAINTVPCALNIRKVLKNKRDSCLRAGSSASNNRTHFSGSCSTHRKDKEDSGKQGSFLGRKKLDPIITQFTTESNPSTSKSRCRYQLPQSTGNTKSHAVSAVSNSRLTPLAIYSRTFCFPKSRSLGSIREKQVAEAKRGPRQAESEQAEIETKQAKPVKIRK